MLEQPNQVLVIDDDEGAREILVELLGRIGYHAFAAGDGKAGLEWLAGAAAPPQAVLLDLRMPVLDGFEVLRRYRADGGTAPVIALSAMDEKETVVKAMRLGASDYLVKPIEPEELKEAIERCGTSRPPSLEEPQAAPIIAAVGPVERPPVIVQARVDANRRGVPTEYVASSPAMLSIWDMVDRVAETDVPVLIRGESGVGKEGIARTVHERSPRRGKPFVKINCAALPSELLESELFGHERGAFTGATSEKPGKFELADEGTIFLDEIGEMHPALQAKLLQVLQDEEYYRVGGKRALRADARVVVATNRVLEDEIAPAISRRPAMQVPLSSGPAGGALPPANQGVPHAMPVATPSASHSSPPPAPVVPMGAETVSLKEIARQAALRAEREAISAMLARTNWNKRKAAARLQISYKALLYKIKDCGLTDPRITASAESLAPIAIVADTTSTG